MLRVFYFPLYESQWLLTDKNCEYNRIQVSTLNNMEGKAIKKDGTNPLETVPSVNFLIYLIVLLLYQLVV